MGSVPKASPRAPLFTAGLTRQIPKRTSQARFDRAEELTKKTWMGSRRLSDPVVALPSPAAGIVSASSPAHTANDFICARPHNGGLTLQTGRNAKIAGLTPALPLVEDAVEPPVDLPLHTPGDWLPPFRSAESPPADYFCGNDSASRSFLRSRAQAPTQPHSAVSSTRPSLRTSGFFHFANVGEFRSARALVSPSPIIQCRILPLNGIADERVDLLAGLSKPPTRDCAANQALV